MRMLELPESVILAVQDTTELDYSSAQGVMPELGPPSGEHSAGL